MLLRYQKVYDGNDYVMPVRDSRIISHRVNLFGCAKEYRVMFKRLRAIKLNVYALYKRLTFTSYN